MLEIVLGADPVDSTSVDAVDNPSAEQTDGRSEFSTNSLSTPLIVSALIISALSVGLFSPIERRMRVSAQWIAGIPRGVYRVISRLGRINILKIAKPYESPLTDEFNSKIEDGETGPIVEESLREIRETLSSIDFLIPSVLGQSRDQVFTAYRPPTIEKLILQSEAEVTEFKNELQSLSINADTYEDLESFYRHSLIVKNNLQALFALVYIRNEKEARMATAKKVAKNPTLRIVEQLQSNDDTAIDALIGAVTCMLLVSFLFYPTLYFLTQDPAVWSTNVRSNETIGVIRDRSILAALFHGLLFWACAGIAIFSRETAMEYGIWRQWTFKHMPYGRIIWHSIFPGLLAIAITASIKFVEYIIFVESGPDALNAFILSNWKFCLMNFVSGLLISVTTLVVLDQHNNFKAKFTVLISLACISLYVIWAMFIQSIDPHYESFFLSPLKWRAREISFLVMPAIAFAMSFALILEVREGQEKRR